MASRSGKSDGDLVCVGVVTGPHGVRGLVRIKSFTEDPKAVAAYGAVSDETGKVSFKLQLVGQASKGQVRVKLEGVKDRDAAEALKGTKLYVPRDVLPEPEEDEFYHADLIGLEARLPDGESLGSVRAVFDFGAGDMLEIEHPNKGVLMAPFTKVAVPRVELAEGWLLIEPLPGLLEPGEPEPGEDAENGE